VQELLLAGVAHRGEGHKAGGAHACRGKGGKKRVQQSGRLVWLALAGDDCSGDGWGMGGLSQWVQGARGRPRS
jgi:hypothetical protein